MRQFGEAPPPLTFFERLKAGLAKSAGALGLDAIVKKKLDEVSLAELEEALIRADLGAAQARAITEEVGKGRYDEDVATYDLRRILAGQIASILEPVAKPLIIDDSKKPFVILVAGVNGTGKTTTIGKIAAKLVRERAARLRDKGAVARAERYAHLTGTEQMLLVEKQGLGRTPCFAPVAFDGFALGAFVRVRITGTRASELTGEILS